jgi:hypothetical protein
MLSSVTDGIGSAAGVRRATANSVAAFTDVIDVWTSCRSRRAISPGLAASAARSSGCDEPTQARRVRDAQRDAEIALVGRRAIVEPGARLGGGARFPDDND